MKRTIKQRTASLLAAGADWLNAGESGYGRSSGNLSWAQMYGILFGQPINRRAAMEVATVYGAMRQIAGGLAQMPLVVKNRQNPSAPEVRNDHEFEYRWNVRACETFTGPAMVEWALLSTMFDGSAIVVMERNMFGDLAGLYPIPWSCVRPERIGNDVVYHLYLNQYTSLAATEGRAVRTVDSEDVLHFHALEFDGCTGQPVIQTGASRPIAVERAMTEHVGYEFSNGALQKHVYEAARRMTKDQKKEFRAQWESTYAKGNAAANVPIVVDGGDKVHSMSQTLREMQLDSARDHQISDIGRAVGIPGVMQNQENKSSSWGTGVQAMTAGFLRFTLQEYVTRWTAEVNGKPFARTPEYVMFDDGALLRGTIKDRYEAHRLSLGGGTNMGWKTANEVRAEEGMPRLDDARFDTPYYPSQSSGVESDSPDEDTTEMNRSHGHGHGKEPLTNGHIAEDARRAS